jgi:hypothetical protein
MQPKPIRDPTCAICMEDVTEPTDPWFPCDHRMHKGCLEGYASFHRLVELKCFNSCRTGFWIFKRVSTLPVCLLSLKQRLSFEKSKALQRVEPWMPYLQLAVMLSQGVCVANGISLFEAGGAMSLTDRRMALGKSAFFTSCCVFLIVRPDVLKNLVGTIVASPSCVLEVTRTALRHIRTNLSTRNVAIGVAAVVAAIWVGTMLANQGVNDVVSAQPIAPSKPVALLFPDHPIRPHNRWFP